MRSLLSSNRPQTWFRLLFLIAATVGPFTLPPNTYGQYRADVWTADSGLPQNIVRGIAQTPDGYLWIATLDGLARFDGIQFVIFDKNNTPGIISNRIESILNGTGGDLWLYNEGGRITRFRGGAFETYGPQQGIEKQDVLSITADLSGSIWILTNKGIERWSESAQRFEVAVPSDQNLNFRPFAWENTGFWAIGPKGVDCFIRGRRVFYPFSSALTTEQLWGVALNQDDTILLETMDGRRIQLSPDKPVAKVQSVDHPFVSSYIDHHGHSWTIKIGKHLSRSIEYLSSGSATRLPFFRLFEDRDKNLWLGTEGKGLYRLQPQSIRSISQEDGLQSDNVYPILRDHEEAMWVGSWPAGLTRYQAGKFTRYTPKEGLPGAVSALGEDRRHRLWIGTHGGVCIFAHGKIEKAKELDIPSGSVVQAILQTRDGTLWFGSRDGLFSLRDGVTKRFTVKDGLQTNDIHVLIEDRDGALWIGGYGGLAMLRNGSFTRWSEKDGLPSENIRSLYQDSDGGLWVGSYDNGMGRFKDGKWTHFDTENGLFNNGVFQILEDRHGNFWISCNRGIYRIRKQDLNDYAAGAIKSIVSVALGKADGMINIECNGGLWPAGAKSPDGKLWFPTQDGVAVVDPSAVPIDPNPPNVIIESVQIDRIKMPLSDPVQVLPGQQSLEIQYTASSFTRPDQIRFRYWMEGLDAGWVDVGTRRTAYFSHLPPGRYTFKVTAVNSDGLWNTTGKDLRIVVVAPFYEKRWFRLLASLLTIVLIVAAARYRIAQHQRASAAQRIFSQKLIGSQESERKRIAAELHDSLGQRLIVINNLALFSLDAAARYPQDKETYQTIEEINKEAVRAIEETRNISYNLRPFRLDRLGLRKAIQSLVRTIKRVSGLAITCEIDDIDLLLAKDQRINFYRIIQESLNNIVKHAQARNVSVLIRHLDQKMVLSIHDDGQGFSQENVTAEKQGGFGLTGMSERAVLLGGNLKIRSGRERGTIIVLEIPLTESNRG